MLSFWEPAIRVSLPPQPRTVLLPAPAFTLSADKSSPASMKSAPPLVLMIVSAPLPPNSWLMDPPEARMMSLPSSPYTVLAPSPALTLSSPVPALMLSLPVPAIRVSLPSSPRIVLAPPPATTLSSPMPALKLSLPPPATSVSLPSSPVMRRRVATPLPPKMESWPSPPINS